MQTVLMLYGGERDQIQMSLYDILFNCNLTFHIFQILHASVNLPSRLGVAGAPTVMLLGLPTALYPSGVLSDQH